MDSRASDPAAEEIAEDLLYRTGKAWTEGQLDLAAECFLLPQFMETVDGNQLIETKEGVCNVFASVRAYYLENNVVDVVRTVVSAEFLTSDTIGSIHVSRLLQPEGECFRAPYPVYSTLKRERDGWKIASTSYAILDDPGHNKALRPNEPDA